MSPLPSPARHLTRQWRTDYLRKLLAWFTQYQRDLPWRSTRDPYAIWISETMLQQTQVATVIDYFNRFIQRFPDVQTLARASEQEVLSMWAGLGYYRRARQLHAAAQQVVILHAGKFPEAPQALDQLPGIGRYTSGAIASIAYGQLAPIVEANTERLYARLLKLERPVREPESTRLLWHFAQWQLEGIVSLPPSSEIRDAGHVNQAVMELGALLCKPVDPQCLVCPLLQLCPTAKAGLQQSVPVPKPKQEFTALHHVALIAKHRGRWLLRLNPPGGWWHGLWDFPRVDVTELRLQSPGNTKQGASASKRFSSINDGDSDRILQLAHEQLRPNQASPLFSDLRQPLLSMSHGVTRYRIALDGIAVTVEPRLLKNDDQWQWVDRQTELPLTATAKKILSKLTAQA